MGKLGLGLGVGRRRSRAAAPAGPAPLITNGGFDADANWAKSGEDASPTISGGLAHFTDHNNASGQQLTQDLAGGPVAAGNYTFSIDLSSINGASEQFFIKMLDAGGVARGSYQVNFLSIGTANRTVTNTITTSAICTQVQLEAVTATLNADNFSLAPA